MNNIKKRNIYWFVKKKLKGYDVIGLLREREGGCFIIGGPTGSHNTGHGEIWREKLDEYIKQGYIDIASAKKEKIIPENWTPPKISNNDQKIIDLIMQDKV